LPIRRDTRRIDTSKELQDITQIRFYGEYMQCMKRIDKGNETKCKEITLNILESLKNKIKIEHPSKTYR
jgi:hypothetical protein